MPLRWALPLIVFGFLGCQAGPLWVSLPESPVPYDRAWQVALETTLLYYDRIAFQDKEAGFFQTAWNESKDGLFLGAPVKRTRLIGQVSNRAPFRLHLSLEEEAFSLELGRWVFISPNKDFLARISQDMRSKLQRF